MLLNALEILLTHLPCHEGADRLKGRDDGQVLTLPTAWLDGAAIDIDGWNIGPCDADHTAGHVLVAATDDENPVHPLSLHAGLDTIGNHLARDEGVLHAFSAHR